MAERFSVAINERFVGRIPAGDIETWREFNATFTNKWVTVYALAGAIQDGHAYTTHHKDYRRSENFLRGQHVALDFDTQDERSTFDVLLEDHFIREHASLLHTTASHTPWSPRARVVFLFDRPVKDREEYILFSRALTTRYDLADPLCKDPCRSFFGSVGAKVKIRRNVLPVELARSELAIPYRQQIEAEMAAMTASLAAEREMFFRQRHERESAGVSYVTTVLLREHQLVATTPKGGRHFALLQAAIRIGSLLKAPWIQQTTITEQDAVDILMDAAGINGQLAEDGERAIQKTIFDGLAYAKPRWDRKEKENETSTNQT